MKRSDFLRLAAAAPLAALLPSVETVEPVDLEFPVQRPEHGVERLPDGEVRYYARIAVDNRLVADQGAFKELERRIFDQLWEAWR